MNGSADAVASARAKSTAETAAQLEADIDALRSQLGDVAGELDRRRHRIANIPGQLRRHAKPLAIGSVALAGLGLGIWWWRSRRSVTTSLLARLPARLPTTRSTRALVQSLRGRVAEAIRPAPPTHVVRSALVKVSTTALAAAASVLAKQLASDIASGRWQTRPRKHGPRT
jgi:hypothetical protein